MISYKRNFIQAEEEGTSEVGLQVIKQLVFHYNRVVSVVNGACWLSLSAKAQVRE